MNIAEREARLVEVCQHPRVEDRDPRFTCINSVAGLVDLVQSLSPAPRSVVEVGSNVGVSTEVFLLFVPRVVAVDPWPNEALHQEFLARVGRYPNLEVVRAESPAAAARFADGGFDLLYVDARHDYASVRADLLAFDPKVRAGGYLAGHDHFDNGDPGGGVVAAVRDLYGGPQRVFSDSSWLVQKGA